MAVAPPHARRDSVVLLHGIGVGSWTLKKLDRALQRRGFATLNLDYSSRKKPLEALAEEIHAPIAAFDGQCDGAIHFVAPIPWAGSLRGFTSRDTGRRGLAAS